MSASEPSFVTLSETTGVGIEFKSGNRLKRLRNLGVQLQLVFWIPKPLSLFFFPVHCNPHFFKDFFFIVIAVSWCACLDFLDIFFISKKSTSSVSLRTFQSLVCG
jgi:hypothetical protein